MKQMIMFLFEKEFVILPQGNTGVSEVSKAISPAMELQQHLVKDNVITFLVMYKWVQSTKRLGLWRLLSTAVLINYYLSLMWPAVLC